MSLAVHSVAPLWVIITGFAGTDLPSPPTARHGALYAVGVMAVLVLVICFFFRRRGWF